MEFTNTFTIPVDVDEAFAVLTDLERVAPCMPGARLETVDGDTYTGRVKVKVGPMSLTYRGTAEVVDADPEAHTARISARGNDARGGGTANADVSARLTEVEGGTEVVVETNIDITGKPAQFGRGVMADVGAKIIDRFAECLSRRLAESDEPDADDADADDADADGDGGGASGDGEVTADEATPDGGDVAATDDGDSTASSSAVASAPVAAAAATAAAPAAPASTTSSGPRRVASSEPEMETLDILDVAGDAGLRRALPLLAAVGVIGLVIWVLRRGRD